MKKTTLAIIGAGGYGDYCLGLLERFVDDESYQLVAAIDPFYENVPRYAALSSAGVPFYRTPSEFYAVGHADLVLIASPIQMHRAQCIEAMQAGCDVLCEKPLAPLLQDVYAIRAVQNMTGRRLGVGFQMSFCAPMLALKQDIHAGLLGAPRSLRCFVSWQRPDSYYDSPWRGKLRDAQGNWVLDSILTNATAHYLHNACFLMGDTVDQSALPRTISAELYNGKGIPTFDTAFVSGKFDNGCALYLAVTHAGDRNIDPVLCYEFDEAVVTASGNDDSAEIIATFRDGTTKNYGAALGEYHVAQKLRTMLDCSLPIPCTAATVLPQLTVCNALFDQAQVHPLPANALHRVSTPEKSTQMPGLTDDAFSCFTAGMLPSAQGLSWACAPSMLTLQDYTAFSGARFDAKEGFL